MTVLQLERLTMCWMRLRALLVIHSLMTWGVPTEFIMVMAVVDNLGEVIIVYPTYQVLNISLVPPYRRRRSYVKVRIWYICLTTESLSCDLLSVWMVSVHFSFFFTPGSTFTFMKSWSCSFDGRLNESQIPNFLIWRRTDFFTIPCIVPFYET